MIEESSKFKAQSSKEVPAARLQGLGWNRPLARSTQISIKPLEPGASFELLTLSFELPGCLLPLVACALLVGCSPETSGEQTTLDSRLFSHVEIIGTRGTGVGQLNKPRSVALDKDDNLYLVDMTGRVQKFSPRGEVMTSWRLPETDLGKPKGMCRDANGNIVVVEPHYQRVNHFAPDGTLVEQWGMRGTNIGQLVLPRSVIVNSRGDIFVSEYTTVDRVQGFSGKDHKPFLCIGRPGTGDGEFNRAEGLGIDAQDRIYVADSCNHRIQIFSRDGKWLKTYGRAGRGLGELSYPYDVKVDPEGRQFVCEFGNSRIQVFGTNNQPLEILDGAGAKSGHSKSFGGAGARPGQFNNPWSIALDSHGNLYVADAGNHRVQKFVRRASISGNP
jgi:DNA-binding beta-propeller fold protein YncE